MNQRAQKRASHLTYRIQYISVMKYTEYADGERCGPGRAWHHRRTLRPAVTGDVRPELWGLGTDARCRQVRWLPGEGRGVRAQNGPKTCPGRDGGPTGKGGGPTRRCGWKVERMGVGGDNLRRVGREMGVGERANGVRWVGNNVVRVGKNVVEKGKKAVLGEEMWGWGVQPTAFLLFLQML